MIEGKSELRLSTTFQHRLPRWVRVSAFVAGALALALSESVAGHPLARPARVLLALGTACVVLGIWYVWRWAGDLDRSDSR